MTPATGALPPSPPQPGITTLSNGVTLLNAPSASRNVGVFLIVRAGSRDETEETAGLAHYLEHMFFKGTERRPTTRQITREIDRLGAATNAYTDTEEVGYYAEGPATAMVQLADIICDMLSRPLFAVEEVERERNVVLQELSARLADPDGWIWDRLGTVTFGGGQSLSWSAAGFPRVVERATRDQLVEYHRAFYAPTAMCLTVAGGASLAPEQAETLLRDIPSAAPRPREAARWGQGERFTGNVRPLTPSEEPQTKMVLAIPGIPSLDEQRTALSVMAFILGGGMSSRLFHTVRERNGLAYAIFAHHEGLEDAGVFAIATATRPKDAVKAVRLSFRELRKLADRGVPQGELVAAKSAMIGRMLRSTETAMASARFYATRWRSRLPLETPDERAAAVARVGAAEVQAVARRIADGLAQVRLAFVGPEEQGDALIQAALDGGAA